MVDRPGAFPWRWRRWYWMVSGPASRPSSSRCLRMVTISFSSSTEVWVGRRWGGRRQRYQGLVATRVESDDLLGHPRFRHADRRSHRPEGLTFHQHGIDCITSTVHGHHLSRCPRCHGTCRPLSDGTRHRTAHRHPRRQDGPGRGVPWSTRCIWCRSGQVTGGTWCQRNLERSVTALWGVRHHAPHFSEE